MSLKKFLLDCLFPQQCYGCKKCGTWLCPTCLLKIKSYQEQLPRHLTNIDTLIIAGNYSDQVLQDLIKAFKFNFNRDLSIPLTIFLYQHLPCLLLTGNYLIIPIPLHRQRLNWRGFNQSELIANELSSLTNWPVNLDLEKKQKTKEQAGLKEQARLNNQQGVFRWRGPNLTGQNIILFDDIITSGATISAAALVLKQAGAGQIIALALAKG